MKAAVWEPLPWRDPTTITALTGAAAKRFLSHQWATLYDQDDDATPFQAPGWVAGWAAALPPTATLLVLVAETPARGPIAALALEVDRNEYGKQRLRPLGAPHAEYIRAVGPGSSWSPVAAALAQYLFDAAADGAVVVMPDLPSDTCLGQILHAQPEWQHTHVMCAKVDLPVDFAALSRSTRRDHVRRERIWSALTAQGRVGYTHTRTSDELALGFSAAQQLHRRRWAGHPNPADLDQTGLLEVIKHCGPTEAFVATLRLDSAVVAAAVCLHRGGDCYSLLPAWDPAVADLAPGHALTRRLAASLTLQGYRRLDLGRTLPHQISYKRQYNAVWTSTVTAVSAGGTW